MSKTILMSLVLLILVFAGCGDSPPADGESSSVSESGRQIAKVPEFELSSPEIEVGQWVKYGTEDPAEYVIFSVVAAEVYQGMECLWVQVGSEEFTGQVLVDPAGFEILLEYSTEEWILFTDDPSGYIRMKMEESEDMPALLLEDESRALIVDFIRAIKIVKFDSGGSVMAIDLTGVADFVEEQMEIPEMMAAMEQEVQKTDGAEMDSILAELDNLQIDVGVSEFFVESTRETMDGYTIAVEHPEWSITINLSNEIPIIPFASAKIVSSEETVWVEVMDYGFEGAVNQLPETPEQTILAMMFLQGMAQQFGQGSTERTR